MPVTPVRMARARTKWTKFGRSSDGRINDPPAKASSRVRCMGLIVAAEDPSGWGKSRARRELLRAGAFHPIINQHNEWVSAARVGTRLWEQRGCDEMGPTNVALVKLFRADE